MSEAREHERSREQARMKGRQTPGVREDRNEILTERKPFEGPGPRRNLEADEKKVEQAREDLDSVSGH